MACYRKHALESRASKLARMSNEAVVGSSCEQLVRLEPVGQRKDGHGNDRTRNDRTRKRWTRKRSDTQPIGPRELQAQHGSSASHLR